MINEAHHEEFFAPGNQFLVVGATNNEEKYGSKVFQDLRAAGYTVTPINRHGDRIHGAQSYPSVSAFLTATRAAPDTIVLVLVVPPAAALATVQEASRLGITKAWFQPGAESDEALAHCAAQGCTVIHDQCIMIHRPR